MSKTIEEVKADLIANGFQGLVAEGAECGCELDDLVPCGGDCSQCIPGYKHADPRPEQAGSWAIWKQKEPPTAKQWALVQY